MAAPKNRKKNVALTGSISSNIKPERCAQCSSHWRPGSGTPLARFVVRSTHPKFKDYILPLIFLKRLSDVFDDEVQRVADEVGDSTSPNRSSTRTTLWSGSTFQQ